MSICLAAVKLEVVVGGVAGPIKKNVLAQLTIYLQKDSPRLHQNAIRQLHRKADEDIRSALEPFGYYNPVIASSLVKKAEGWKAEYTVDPGPPVIVEDVSIRLSGVGETNAKLQKTIAALQLKKGDILNQDTYEKEKKRLIRAAFSAGFLDAAFTEKSIRLNRRLNTATVRLVFDSGAQYVFGETDSVQEILKQDLLDRYLPYKAGDPYSPKKLFELQSILYRTDYFSRVAVSGKTDDAIDFVVPVEIELVPPKHYNRYSLGAGYATDTGFRGKVDWANRLFNSRGHKLSAFFQLAELENTLSLRYELPRKDPRYDTLLHNIAYQDKTWQGTTTQLLTASVSRAYSDPRFKLSGGLELRDEVYDVGDTSGDSTLLIPSISSGMVLADNILHTQNGLQASVSLLGSVKGLISDVSFLQTSVSGKTILSPLSDWRLIGRGTVGATLVDSIDSLPPSLRFYTGGDNTIRGYSYKSIGTRDSSGVVIGGRYQVVGSVEVERIIRQDWSVAAFWDGGTATDDLSLNFYQGAGVGVRFRLPFGQIRLDLASAITEDGNPFRVHLTVGGDL